MQSTRPLINLSKMPKQTYLALYMPVLHRGYMQLFAAHKSIKQALIIDNDLLKSVDYIRKDIRALSPNDQVAVLEGLERFDSVELLSEAAIKKIDTNGVEVVLPDEDVSRAVGARFKHAQVSYYPVFLRWDRSSVEALNEEAASETVTDDAFHREVMNRALKRAGTSADIWRRVGAVLITKRGEEFAPLANQGEPTAHSPWMEGDPRNIFNRGVGIEMSLFTHAEAGLIAEAARRGVSTQGAALYASTFPCPACAKLIAHSGVKTCYYAEGYAVLDGASIMKEYGVKLIKVQMPNSHEKPGPEAVPYKK